jgi:hypothetical protein
VAWHQDTALPLREQRDVAGWGPWSVKDGVNYAHAPAQALERILALRKEGRPKCDCCVPQYLLRNFQHSRVLRNQRYIVTFHGVPYARARFASSFRRQAFSRG